MSLKVNCEVSVPQAVRDRVLGEIQRRDLRLDELAAQETVQGMVRYFNQQNAFPTIKKDMLHYIERILEEMEWNWNERHLQNTPPINSVWQSLKHERKRLDGLDKRNGQPLLAGMVRG